MITKISHFMLYIYLSKMFLLINVLYNVLYNEIILKVKEVEDKIFSKIYCKTFIMLTLLSRVK